MRVSYPKRQAQQLKKRNKATETIKDAVLQMDSALESLKSNYSGYQEYSLGFQAGPGQSIRVFAV
jgi:hypothetical protein